jgi:hypothetical protein
VEPLSATKIGPEVISASSDASNTAVLARQPEPEQMLRRR